ncbi:MAG: NAD(P)H-dependent oxidoreductase [Porticoccus sp.]|nr:NAD(P)H-dependent oxidoreductase [Porticoccus sp.]MBQ0807119.1 NAD(P)H-dependent oxidoreductase [Porticoccus sp.]
MSKLLYIESSPRKDRSASIEVAQSFVSAFQDANTGNQVESLDLWDATLPEFDGDRINAKYRVMHGESPTTEEALAWEEITNIVARFKNADHYLFSLPMWNFSIPYKLKHYIDLICQPGLTWSFSPETGYQGLVTGRSATLILARGGEYSSSAEAGAMDFQKSYMEMVLGFMGFQDINTVLVEPTLTDADTKGKTLAAMKEKATNIAKQL